MLAIASAFILATVQAPVYLQCTTMQRGKAIEWEITLNEAQGTVDYHTSLSGPQRRPARYTADKVFFIDFTLSRVDLSMSRPLTNLIGELLGHELGQCRLIEKTSRAF